MTARLTVAVFPICLLIIASGVCPCSLWAAAPIKLNGAMVAGGDVSAGHFTFSPDSSRVLYHADQTTDNVDEIFSVPSTGGVATKLNGALVANGDVNFNSLQFSPDSSRVLYRADQTTDEVFEIYSVPSAGGTATKLNGTLVTGGDVSTMQFSPDSSRVLYGADQTTDEVFEIYSVPSAGGTATKLNGTLVAGGDVSIFPPQFSPDSSRVLYGADQTTDEVFEIFIVPHAGGTATKLNGTLVAGGDILSFPQFSPDSSRVLYRADQTTNDVFELFSVPSAGGVATKLNGPLVAGGNVSPGLIAFSPDLSRVLYHADQTTNDVFEIFSVPSAGGTATKLNGALVAGGNVDFQRFSPDSSRVVYQADQTTDEVFEIFSVPSAGGTATKLNGTLVAGGDASNNQFSPDGSRVLYRADQTTDEVFEIFSVPSAGGVATKLNGNLVAGGDVINFPLHFSPDSSRVLYLADQSADEVFEIFIVPSAGGTATKLNGASVTGGDVSTMQFSPNGSLVLYHADQNADDVSELYVRIVVQHSLASGGNWDAGEAWNHGGEPDNVMQVYVDAPGTVTASGVGTRTVNELVVGGGTASSTLALASGAGLESLHGMTIANKGVVRGDGVIVAGTGGLTVAAGGQIQVGAGDRLSVSSPIPIANAGRIEAIGTAASPASIEFDSAVTNSAGMGSIVARNAMLRFNGGLTNHSAIALSFGTTDVMGDVTNSATGTIAVAGNSGVTFYDDVTNSGTLNVAGGSTAVFFGALAGNGNVGSGAVQALGDLLPGASPGTMAFGGDLTMGPLTNLNIEIAGLTPGTQHDRLVASSLMLAGTLQVSLINPFTPSHNDSFDIINGTISGTFSTLQLPDLPGTLGWDISDLYTDGVLSVTAFLAGDFNRDGVTTTADIPAMLDALVNLPAYKELHTLSVSDLLAIGDLNNSSTLTNADLQGLLSLLATAGSGAANPVPEPDTIILAGLGIAILIAIRRRPLRRGQAHFAPRTAQNEPVPDGFGLRRNPLTQCGNLQT